MCVIVNFVIDIIVWLRFATTTVVSTSGATVAATSLGDQNEPSKELF